MRARIDKVPLSFDRRSRLCVRCVHAARRLRVSDRHVTSTARLRVAEARVSLKGGTRGAPHEERMENSLRSLSLSPI